ncbi:hypothetical protein MA16_Dca027834 [Dendrobium catenatum]|uniref:Uncharacterized protein n=1 Tax=Dendrobium catenatum TaxID=906689 RepID=A0A2I0VBZ5_9ASPA|nr:hypothetical protein MA16_Dca027834 [Dendrobium catenatum]
MVVTTPSHSTLVRTTQASLPSADFHKVSSIQMFTPPVLFAFQFSTRIVVGDLPSL